jgi:LuxR family maltose regulon positive regulatory protein
VIEILVVLALAYESQADTTSALIHLEAALKLAEPEGYVRIFVDEGPPMARLLYEAFSQRIAPDYVRKLLAVFPDITLQRDDPEPKPKSRSDGIDPLSDREIEVLQLMAEGLTNQAIADRLFLSLHTVKAHARNLYAKLGATSRTQAIARGRVLGVLDTYR